MNHEDRGWYWRRWHPHFALPYGGTPKLLNTNSVPPEKAQEMLEKFHAAFPLLKVRLNHGQNDGSITVGDMSLLRGDVDSPIRNSVGD